MINLHKGSFLGAIFSHLWRISVWIVNFGPCGHFFEAITLSFRWHSFIMRACGPKAIPLHVNLTCDFPTLHYRMLMISNYLSITVTVWFACVSSSWNLQISMAVHGLLGHSSKLSRLVKYGYNLCHMNPYWTYMDPYWIHSGPIWAHGPMGQAPPNGQGLGLSPGPSQWAGTVLVNKFIFFIELSTPAKNKFINQIFF